MFWFIIHTILNPFSSIEKQTRNLITFLTGTFLYVFIYSYGGLLDYTENLFLKRLFDFFIYFVIADTFAMAIIYKKFYKQTTFTELKEIIDSMSNPVNVKHVASAKPTSITNRDAKNDNNNVVMPLLKNESYDACSDNGFAKDSALGEAFNTGGKSNK